MADDRDRDDESVPTGRLGRFAKLARLGARTGASLLLSKTGEAAAERAADVLGNMRGIAAKVGQLASYVDGFVPEEHRASYDKHLRALQSAAVRSPFEEVRRTVEEELGAPLGELFPSFEEEPFASASIGQVHRARTPDGREVAVKVQHPGIAKAVESDLANAGLLESMVGTAIGKHFGSKQLLEEVKQRFREELDYGLEAERQRSFAKIHEGDPTISIPDVIASHSRRRVLTTELARGEHLDEAVKEPEDARRRWAEILWRFVYKGNLVGGMFNADPHPGNYLFQEGRIVFLDFGCVEPIPPARRENARALHVAAARRDEDAFRAQARIILGTKPGRWEDIAIGYARRSFEPLFASPYRIEPAFVAGLVADVRSRKLEVVRLGKGEFTPPPPGMLFMNRLQFGFYSVLAKLDAAVDYVAVERGFLGPI